MVMLYCWVHQKETGCGKQVALQQTTFMLSHIDSKEHNCFAQDGQDKKVLVIGPENCELAENCGKLQTPIRPICSDHVMGHCCSDPERAGVKQLTSHLVGLGFA